MAKIIGLPKLSPTMEEGTLVAWIKKEGDEVDVDDLLAEVETDKATMEFRSFDRGVLLKILVPEGETLEPDVPVAIIGKAGEDISDLLAQVAETWPDQASEAEAEPGQRRRQRQCQRQCQRRCQRQCRRQCPSRCQRRSRRLGADSFFSARSSACSRAEYRSQRGAGVWAAGAYREAGCRLL